MTDRPYEELDCRSLVDVDLPEVGPVTEETRQRAIEHAQRYGTRGSVRLALGRFYSNVEYERYRKEVLSRNLP